MFCLFKLLPPDGMVSTVELFRFHRLWEASTQTASLSSIFFVGVFDFFPHTIWVSLFSPYLMPFFILELNTWFYILLISQRRESSTNAKIKIHPFCLHRGLAQGCVLSSSLMRVWRLVVSMSVSDLTCWFSILQVNFFSTYLKPEVKKMRLLRAEMKKNHDKEE